MGDRIGREHENAEEIENRVDQHPEKVGAHVAWAPKRISLHLACHVVLREAFHRGSDCSAMTPGEPRSIRGDIPGQATNRVLRRRIRSAQDPEIRHDGELKGENSARTDAYVKEACKARLVVKLKKIEDETTHGVLAAI